ncbi:hypothetical protein JCM10213v2_003542 [Rhodosporidiobolus nylandii]
MGHGPAEARVCLFYGLPVRTRSLILAGIAYSYCIGAVNVLDELRAAGRQKDGPVAQRVPVEVWDKVERALVTIATHTIQWVKLDDFVAMSGEEEAMFRCSECEAVCYREKIIDALLCPYGLALPTIEQYTLSRHDCAPPSAAAFISLSSRVRVPTAPTARRTLQFNPAHTRNTFFARHRSDDYDFDEESDGEPEQEDEMMLVTAPRRVPKDADQRFESLRKDWPLLEYLAFEDAELRFDDAEKGVEENEGEERVAPSWRVFLRAKDYANM